MQITIRRTEPEDYPALIRIFNDQNEPHHHLTEEELRRGHERGRAKGNHQLAALEGTRVVGLGQFGVRADDPSPGKYWGWFFVHRDYRNRGVDTALWDEAVSLLVRPVSIWTCVREDFVATAGYLREREYREQFRSWGANLDLAGFDVRRASGLEEALKVRGIRLRSYPELSSDPLRDEKLLELQARLEEEAPHHEPIIPKRHPTIRDEETLIESLVVAVSGDEYVGLASLLDGGLFSEAAGSGFTGVKAAYRNLGVATAMKARTGSWAKARGYRAVNAGGSGDNAAILSVNRRIGFEVEPDWITFARHL
ncbi:MAG TPA: GNAT family N-acetyltransferase [Trueperaceae bacterium]